MDQIKDHLIRRGLRVTILGGHGMESFIIWV